MTQIFVVMVPWICGHQFFHRLAAIELGIVSTEVDCANESGLVVGPRQSCSMGNLRNFSDGREKKN